MSHQQFSSHNLVNMSQTVIATACVMMKLFRDSLLKFAILGSKGSPNAKPDSLTLYTQEMADEMDELLAGVVVDGDE
jgi:hypothetical protein